MKVVGAKKGFSLVELMISLAITLVISAAAFYVMGAYQKIYRSSQFRADMQDSMRGALQLMAQEIGQAGMFTFTPRTMTQSVATAGSRTVTLSSTANIFLGEKLLIDSSSAEELVTVTAVTGTSITAVFAGTHSSGAAVRALGAFPTGILTTSAGSTLQLFGDLDNAGVISFVEYVCNTSTGNLTRSVTPIAGAASKSAGDLLVTGIVANPSGAACFRPITKTVSGYTFVKSIGITLSIQTAGVDPQTNAYGKMTESFLNLSPRNVLAALEMAENSLTSRLQPQPANVPLL